MNTLYYILNEKNTLWEKSKYSKTNNIKDIKNLKIKSKNQNSLLENKFAISEEKFILLKDDNCKAFINLNYIGIDYDKLQMKIIFFTQSKFFSVYFNDMNNFKYWKKMLMNKCVMNNFQKRYDVISKINEIEGSKFYLVNKKSNKKNHFIKVISKKNLKTKEDYNQLLNEIEKSKKLCYNKNLYFYQLYESKGSFYIVYKTNLYNNLNFLILQKEAKINLLNKIFEENEDVNPIVLKNEELFLKIIQNINYKRYGIFGFYKFISKEYLFSKINLNYNQIISNKYFYLMDIINFLKKLINHKFSIYIRNKNICIKFDNNKTRKLVFN